MIEFLIAIAILMSLGFAFTGKLLFDLKNEALQLKQTTKELLQDSTELLSSKVKDLNAKLLKSEDLTPKLTSALEQNLILLNKNKTLEAKQKEYKQFFSLMLDVLNEDTSFLRSDLFRRFGEVPEYMTINSQIIAFENKVNQIKLTLKELKMMEDYDE